MKNMQEGVPIEGSDKNLSQKVEEAIEQSKSLIPTVENRPTDKQIAFAVKAGIDPSGLTKKQLSIACDQVLSDLQIDEKSLQGRREYLRRLVDPKSVVDIDSITDQEVLQHIKQEHDQLEQNFPVGSSVEFMSNGQPKQGVIAGYFFEGMKRAFSLRRESGNRAIALLTTAERMHEYLDPSAQEIEELRRRIKGLVEECFRQNQRAIDVSIAVPKTVSRLMDRFRKRKSALTDEDILQAVQKLEGKTF